MRAHEGLACIGLQVLGSPLFLIRQECRDERDLPPGQGRRVPPLSLADVDPARHDGGLARPRFVRIGRVDHGAFLADESLQSHLSGAPLGDGVDRQQPEVAILPEQIEGTEVEVGDQVGRTPVSFGQPPHEILAICPSEGSTDTMATHEGRIPHDRIEATVLPLEYFGELQGPVEGTPRWLARGQVGAESLHGPSSHLSAGFFVAPEEMAQRHGQRLEGSVETAVVAGARQCRTHQGVGHPFAGRDGATGFPIESGHGLDVSHVTDGDRTQPLAQANGFLHRRANGVALIEQAVQLSAFTGIQV